VAFGNIKRNAKINNWKHINRINFRTATVAKTASTQIIKHTFTQILPRIHLPHYLLRHGAKATTFDKFFGKTFYVINLF